MKAIIVGGGIGGLTTALMLRARGIACELFEQSEAIRELGVGINTLPHAIRELAGLGRLDAFSQDEGGVTAYFFDRTGAHVKTARGDILVGADGIHSRVRETLFPDEGPPCWNGLMLWRGARDWPVFLTGKSMIVAGGLHAKVVVYPIAEGSSPASRLTNWAVLVKVGDGNAAPPRREDWSGPGKPEELMPE